jgi:hypothetical protein
MLLYLLFLYCTQARDILKKCHVVLKEGMQQVDYLQLFQNPIARMKSAGISDLKATLKTKSQAQLLDLCLRLARAKKENKELLTYLLYEADDELAYIQSLKKELETEFADINTGHLLWVKKSLRKIVRFLNKHIRYTGSKTAEVELRIYFCTLLQQSKIPFTRSTALTNLYHGQVKKAEAALNTLHEDLQRDYRLQLDALEP